MLDGMMHCWLFDILCCLCGGAYWCVYIGMEVPMCWHNWLADGQATMHHFQSNQHCTLTLVDDRLRPAPHPSTTPLDALHAFNSWLVSCNMTQQHLDVLLAKWTATQRK